MDRTAATFHSRLSRAIGGPGYEDKGCSQVRRTRIEVASVPRKVFPTTQVSLPADESQQRKH